MKFVSWNVNGLRACIQKGFLEQFDQFDADFFCLQETKLSEGQLQLDLPGYEQYWCYADKKGYSGTAIFTKHTPQGVHYGLDVPELDNEGRLITLEYPEFYLVTCYTPNAQRGLARIDHRMTWDDAFRAYLQKLDALKPVILCGDLNVAHQEIDLKNPKSNRGNAGFSDQERDSFQKTLDAGFTDTFRHLHPDKTGAYSWWSYMFHARENNAGWRIDYFLVSDRLQDAIYRAEIHSDVLGSDHCPVSLDLGLICNGGIWSPMSQGAARQTFPAEKEENPKNDEAKASAKPAKALVALGLVAMLIASVLLFWQPSGDPEPTNSENPFTVPNIPDAFTVTTLEEPLYQEQSDTGIYRIINESGTTQAFARDLHLGDNFASSSVYIYRDLSEWNSWFLVELSPQAKELLADYDLTLSPIVPNYARDGYLQHILYVSEIYADPACQDLIGWLVYGDLEPDSQVHFSLITANSLKSIYSTVVEATPYLSRENAAAMSTEELFRFAASHSGVQNYLDSNGNIVELPNRYPFMAVLLDRTDAVSTIMNCSLRDYDEMLFAYQLLCNCFLPDMTPREEAALWMGDYPSSPFTDTPLEIDPPENLGQITTPNLLHSALEFYDYSILPQCTSQEAAYQVFRYWLSNPYWAELVTRDDALSALTQLCSQDSRCAPLLDLWNYLPERLRSSEMTASELVDFILADPDRCLSIFSAGSFLQPYAYSDPYLSALLEQDDAIEALLDATIPAEGDARIVPTRLLYYLFADEMTPRQAAKLVTGLHNSAVTPFTFSLNYPLDLAEASTGHLVEHLTHYGADLYGFLHVANAYPDPDAVRLEVYYLLLPHSDILQELRTRTDTVAALRTECINTSVLNSPVDYLLHLYEYYPVIWNSSIPAFNALALQDASAWYESPGSSDSDEIYLHGSFPLIFINRDEYASAIEDSNFAYLVTFPSQYMTTDAESRLTLDVSVMYPGGLPEDSSISCIPCYTDSARWKFCGWLVYGRIHLDAPIRLTLYRDRKVLTGCHFSPLDPPETVAGVRFDYIYGDYEVIIPE